jgi:hypothetical protein
MPKVTVGRCSLSCRHLVVGSGFSQPTTCVITWTTCISFVSNNFCLGHKSTQVCRLREKRPSAARKNLISGYKSSERAKFCCQRPRSIYRVVRRSSGFRGYQVTQDIAPEIAPIFQDKIWVVRSSDAWRKI